MNRLRKLADEQLSLDFDEKINSFDDYLKMYNENYISDFLLNKYVELASSKDAIDRYIEGCEGPEERVDVLENLNENEILNIDSNIIADNLLNKYKAKFSDNYSKQDFENDVNDYILDKFGYDIVELVTENISEFLENEAEKHNSFYYENSVVANELCNIDDSIGEESEIIDTIDFDNRIAAFVDLDGEILVSDDGMTHAQLINEYLKEYDEELNDGWYRPDAKEVNEKSGHVNVAFGHIVNDNVWVIEDYTLTDISVEDVVSDIKASGKKYTKIYSYDTSNVTRVAQLEKQK